MADIRISVGGKDLAQIASDGVPDISAPENLALAALAVHRAVLERATAHADADGRTPPEAEQHNGADGWRWRGSVNSIIGDMWPWMRLGEDEDAVKEAKKELNRYLRSTGNLICTVQGTRTVPSVWFVRGEFSDIPPQQKKETLVTAVKVTAHEAGEDRVPAPVETSLICTWPAAGGICGHRLASDRWLSRHIFGVHRSAESWLTAAMEALGPVTAQEIHDHAAADGYPGSYQNTTYHLRNMAEEGTVSYYGGVYHSGPRDHEEPDEEESGRECPCREPGCGKPFSHPYLRARHEDAAHPYSEARDWRCTLCPRRFYRGNSSSGETEPMRLHLTRSHRLPFGSPDYIHAMEQITALRNKQEPAAPERAIIIAERRAEPVTERAEVTPDQVAAYLKGILDDNERLRSQNDKLAGENQQLTARLRRLRVTLEES